jgi:hypothetical protein
MSTPEERDTDFKDFQSPHDASVERLIQALDRAYHRPWLMMWRAFLSGIMTAVGMAVGYLLIFTLLAYVFQVLGGFKLLEPLSQKLQQSILPPQLRSLQVDSTSQNQYQNQP